MDSSALPLKNLPKNHDFEVLSGILKALSAHGCQFRTCIEGGAHHGIWTRRLMNVFDSVIAFEPQEEAFKALSKLGPGYNGLEISDCALGARYLCARIAPGPRNTGQAHISKWGQACVIAPLDVFYLGAEPVDYIKLDVEGYELAALRGARQTILKNKPFISVELNGLSERYGASDQDIELYLQGLGYSKIGSWKYDHLYKFEGS